MLEKLSKINDNEFNIFSLIYIIYLLKYIIIGITFLAVILSFILYSFLREDYYQLSVNVKPSNNSEISGFVDVPSIISENFNVLLGMVLSSSASRNMGINLPPFNVPTEPTELPEKTNRFDKFIFQIADTKSLIKEVKDSNLLDDFKDTDLETVIKHLQNLTVSNIGDKKLTLNFKMNEKISIDTVDLIITSALNMVLKDLIEVEKELKSSITELMEVITNQYFIDLSNRVEILQERLLEAINNKIDLQEIIKNNSLKFKELNFTANSDPTIYDFDFTNKIAIKPVIIENEIEVIKNRKNHEAFIPGKTILKNTFYLINSSLPSQKIKQSLASPGYQNDKFKFILFKSPDLKDVTHFKTNISTYLLIGLVLGIFVGIFITLMIYFYQAEKKNFIINN